MYVAHAESMVHKTGNGCRFIPWTEIEEFAVRPRPLMSDRGYAMWQIKLRAIEGFLCVRCGYLTGLEGQLIELIKPRIGCPIVIEDKLR